MSDGEREQVVDTGLAGEGHHNLVAQPHGEEDSPVAEAEHRAAELSTEAQPMGSPGRRFDRRSPFFIGLTASAGVAVTYGLVQVLASLSSILVLIGVAFFLALGLEPAASWFVKRKLPRRAATTLVFLIFMLLLGAFVAAAIPPAIGAGLPTHHPGTPNTSNRRRIIPRSSVESTIDSTCSSASPTRSTAPADRFYKTSSPPEPPCSERSPTY